MVKPFSCHVLLADTVSFFSCSVHCISEVSFYILMVFTNVGADGENISSHTGRRVLAVSGK